MDYGIKASVDHWDLEMRAQFGEREEFLGRLHNCGVAFVEMPVGDTPDDDALGEAARACREAGIYVSLHPYLREFGLESFGRPETEQGLRRLLQAAERVGGATGVTVPFVLHGGLADIPPHRVKLPEAVRNAQAFFRWAEAEIAASFPDVRLLCETQLPADLIDDFTRVGDTYETCLELVAGTGVEVCWDFGHTFRSVITGKHAAEPRREFLRRVGHVHAHDTVGDVTVPYCTSDHWPLGAGICPWRRYAELLAGAGYDRTVLFEVGLRRFASFGELAMMLAWSIEALEAVFA